MEWSKYSWKEAVLSAAFGITYRHKMRNHGCHMTTKKWKDATKFKQHKSPRQFSIKLIFITKIKLKSSNEEVERNFFFHNNLKWWSFLYAIIIIIIWNYRIFFLSSYSQCCWMLVCSHVMLIIPHFSIYMNRGLYVEKIDLIY